MNSSFLAFVIARFMRATHFSLSPAGNWIARTRAARGRTMTILCALMIALSVAACGVKSDLVMPSGKPTPKGQKDPSKPPQTMGR